MKPNQKKALVIASASIAFIALLILHSGLLAGSPPVNPTGTVIYVQPRGTDTVLAVQYVYPDHSTLTISFELTCNQFSVGSTFPSWTSHALPTGCQEVK